MAQMRAARVQPARRVPEGYLNALVNAFGLFDQTDASGTFIKHRIFLLNQLDPGLMHRFKCSIRVFLFLNIILNKVTK